MNTTRHSRRGFTLVEIMIVVVIVGILSSIAIPAMMRVKRKAEDTVALNFLRQLYDAKEQYFTEDGAGKHGVNLKVLVKVGYASPSLLATTAHPVGAWNVGGAANFILQPGKSLTLRETFRSGNSVSQGRTMTYPQD